MDPHHDEAVHKLKTNLFIKSTSPKSSMGASAYGLGEVVKILSPAELLMG